VGKEVELLTKGWLPYTLRWRFRVTEVDPPAPRRLEPQGDFTGRGTWTFRQEGQTAVIGYDWDVEARKPLLRALGPDPQTRLRRQPCLGDAARGGELGARGPPPPRGDRGGTGARAPAPRSVPADLRGQSPSIALMVA
jgi:hypothetical protein